VKHVFNNYIRDTALNSYWLIRLYFNQHCGVWNITYNTVTRQKVQSQFDTKLIQQTVTASYFILQRMSIIPHLMYIHVFMSTSGVCACICSCMPVTYAYLSHFRYICTSSPASGKHAGACPCTIRCVAVKHGFTFWGERTELLVFEKNVFSKIFWNKEVK